MISADALYLVCFCVLRSDGEMSPIYLTFLLPRAIRSFLVQFLYSFVSQHVYFNQKVLSQAIF